MDRLRFIELWQRRIGDDGDSVFNELNQLYNQPHRRYHISSHIEQCLQNFDISSFLMIDPDSIEMALWFHDAIYDVPPINNEQQSADFFSTKAKSRGSKEYRSTVYRLINTTAHQQEPSNNDEALMVDIDLSSLGLPWDEFKRNSHDIRTEYADIPDSEFYRKQKDFLDGLLARQPLYSSEFFRERHEDRAVLNITRYLNTIKTLRSIICLC